MNLSGLPNAISIFRILLVFPVAVLIERGNYPMALVLFAVAGISDGLDGYLAKRFDWTSRLGTILDPVADKFLLLTSFLVLTFQGLLPVWLFLLAFVRDLGILGLSSYYLAGRRQGFEIRPQWSSKLNTVAQISLVLLVMLNQALWTLPAWSVDVMVFVVAGTTLWSAAAYFRVWTKNLRRRGTTHER